MVIMLYFCFVVMGVILSQPFKLLVINLRHKAIKMMSALDINSSMFIEYSTWRASSNYLLATKEVLYLVLRTDVN
ncbi:hypothetical protein BCS96_01715 [Vibrio breoganii]|nr:hypothetical protein BCT68_05215 [Vibrio breoganii]PMO97241.1 hypothetical protein BCS96_01715 [Vibrio breoganii]